MIIKMTDIDDNKLYAIPLDVRTKYNYKKEFDGNECNSIISLVINESYMFLNRFEPVSIPYLFSLAIEASDNNVYVINVRNLKSLQHVLQCLTISSAYQGIVKHTITGVPNFSVMNQIKKGVMGRSPETQPHYTLKVYGYQLQFQTLRNLYEENFATEITKNAKLIKNVFSRSPRSFMYAKAKSVFGFCDIQFFETEKLLNDLSINNTINNIEEIKTPITKLTSTEIEASENKAIAILEEMQKLKAKFNSLLSEIPLTRTGIVRKELVEKVCKDEDWGEDEKHGSKEKAYGSRWSRLCANVNRNMTPCDYARLRQIFTGGLCFVSRFDKQRVLKDIDVYDIRSAYVSVLAHMKFPVSNFVEVQQNQYNKYLNETGENMIDINRKEAWYAHFVFHNLQSKTKIAYWQFDKHRENRTDTDTMRVTDGRLISCSGSFEVYLTDLDFAMFNKFYTFDDVEVLGMWKAETSLLPETLLSIILNWYKLKSELPKDSKERDEVKTNLCSIYGIMVTRLYDDDTVFMDGWHTHHLDERLFKEKHDRISSLKTIGSYQIGVWTCAWQRFVLGTLVDDNAIYGDTDSLFGRFEENKFDKYHRFLQKRRKEICKIYESLDTDMYGDLGFIEKESHFEEFKVIGQKRYSGNYYENGELKIKNTIAGLPKINAGIKIKTPKDLSERLTWDTEESGLLATVYNDSQPNVTWTDRDGKTYSSNVKFGAIINKTSFSLSKLISLKNIIEFLGTDLYCVQDAPDATDALFIKESLDD